MDQVFLEFEKPVEALYEELVKVREIGRKQQVDITTTEKELLKRLSAEKKNIYGNLSPWQKVQLSRHPNRPYTLDYISGMFDEFTELHGDRNFGDDHAIVGGMGMLDGETVMVIGHQKGNTTKERQYRNFGMANPEGYRKALRLMKLAEKFNKPVLTFIDTPGAYPGLEAEERGQAEAIARNLFEMVSLKVPVICTVIGEGASGGALGIGIGDRILMLENTWYSVISPESCSSILWRSWDFKETAAEQLKLTAEDLLNFKVIDKIVKEPLGGAHSEPDKMFESLKVLLKEELEVLNKVSDKDRIQNRIDKYSAIGQFTN